MKKIIVFLLIVITGCSIFSTYYISKIYDLEKNETIQRNTKRAFGY